MSVLMEPTRPLRLMNAPEGKVEVEYHFDASTIGSTKLADVIDHLILIHHQYPDAMFDFDEDDYDGIHQVKARVYAYRDPTPYEVQLIKDEAKRSREMEKARLQARLRELGG